MNEHISEELQKKWMNYDFIGKTFKLSDGKTYMRAHSLVFDKIHYYCLEDDWFWHDEPRTPLKEEIESLSDIYV